jgi:hypothetical protein
VEGVLMKHQQAPTLDQRISAALGNGKVAIDDLHALIADVETGIEEAEAYAKQQRERALDPTRDAAEAPQLVAVAELRRDRLKAALPRLQAKLATVLADEYSDRWHADANKVKTQVDAATEQVARYTEMADQIVAVLSEAEAVNQEVDRINGSAPDGDHRRIGKVDLTHLKDLLLPDPDNPGRNLWPRPKPSIAETYAASMGSPAYHPGADWASDDWQRRRAEAARAEQRRMADYYETLTKQQEERQNREALEALQRRRA